MTYLHAKVQGQRPVGSEDGVETNGQTNGRGRLHYLADNAVGKTLKLTGSFMHVFMIIVFYACIYYFND